MSQTSQPLKRAADAAHRRMGVKRCSRCGIPKTLACFRTVARRGKTVPFNWCQVCERLAVAAYQKSPQGKAARRAYRNRPEVAEARNRDKARWRQSPQGQATTAAYGATIRYRLIHARNANRVRLARATDPVKAARITALIAMQDAEIARIDRKRKGDDV